MISQRMVVSRDVR